MRSPDRRPVGPEGRATALTRTDRLGAAPMSRAKKRLHLANRSFVKPKTNIEVAIQAVLNSGILPLDRDHPNDH